MKLEWKKFTYESMDGALSQSHCLYVFHHPHDGDRPFYIGKAKAFGTKQILGYTGSARYNSGYTHLLAGMLRGGFSLYIAQIGHTAFADAEGYEQELIALWRPIRPQKIKAFRKTVFTAKPWSAAENC